MGEQLTPLGAPGPLTQSAIDKAKSLPDNRLDVGAGTTDFKSVDLTAGVKKTWRNGWGAGAWVGLKVGSGKPIGSAGVTVSKSLGLLGEVESMNWLQRNLPHRESWAWFILTAAGVAGYLTAHFETLQAAFELAPIWEERIELTSGLLALLAAKQSWSNMPTELKQNQARAIEDVKRIEKIDLEIDQAIRENKDEPPTS